MEAEDLCRICDKPSAKMFDIFDKNADGKQILKLIRESLPVVIFRRDPLSKRICEGCYENIRRVHAFRRASLDIVNKQRERLRLLQNEDVLLYLDTVNSTDQNELWMFSSPIKKDMGSIHLCHKCKAESPLPLVPPPPPQPGKPFRKYKEAVRKSERSLTTVHVNGYGGNDDPIDLDAEETTQNVSKKEASLPMKRLHKASHTYGSFPKRQRIMGPKSKTQPFIRTFYRKVAVYNPLSLLMCCVNVVNKQNLPNADCKSCERSEKLLETYEYICEYCLKEFGDVKKLAEHELEHIALKVDRVDNLEIWSSSIEGAPVRNKWLRENNEKTAAWQDFDDVVEVAANEEEEEEDDDQNLLMPLVETDNEVKGEIILVDGKPTVNGVPLSDIPKTERRLYYNRTYNLNGVKRKFCPLCRYTFKDNWAIELHYFSSACYYTCRFCGIRFNKQRAQFDEHNNQHIEFGDVMTDKVFAARKKNDPIPKVLCETRSTARQQTNYTTSNNAVAPAQPQKVYPKIKPLKMKQLLEKSNMSVKTTLDAYNDSNNAESKQNQAYFCRKCFKVFFKLDEFNSHVSNCSEYPESDPREVNYRGEEEKYEPPRKYQRHQRASPTNSRSDESFSSTGRPIRNCVKDVTYRDSLDLDVEGEEEEEEDVSNSGAPFKGIECGLCSAVFPTIPSRNSHMRIHKNGFKLASKSHAIFKQHKSINIAQKVMNAYHQQNNYSDGASYSKYDPDIPIKQEPLEPLVEIHESNSVHDIPSSIGAVSITPIPNKMQKTNINPDIMKLVQSNPNITIRSMHQSSESPMSDNNQMDDSVRSYKCSSCSKMFSNKSNLYFHKKNHCEGSRYPCPFCKKRFGTEAAYSSHIFYSHPE